MKGVLPQSLVYETRKYINDIIDGVWIYLNKLPIDSLISAQNGDSRSKSKSKFFIGKYHYIQYSSSYKIEK